MSVEFKDTRVGSRALTMLTISGGHLWDDWFGLKMGYKSTKLAMCMDNGNMMVLWYSYVICFHHIVLEVIYFWYCDFPKFSLVWNPVLYHVLETNWWFLIWSPEIVSIVCIPFAAGDVIASRSDMVVKPNIHYNTGEIVRKHYRDLHPHFLLHEERYFVHF